MHNQLLRARRNRRHRAFTLLQLLIAIAIVGILSALLFGYFGKTRAKAQLSTCDARLKAITLALDAYRQENKAYPATLSTLTDEHLVDAALLRCPADPDPNSEGYAEYYVLRNVRGDDERPILVCPFHGNRNGSEKQIGVQAFAGRYTKQYQTMNATLTKVNNATVQVPGRNAIAGASGMTLRGGDRIRTGPSGAAVISFSDGSTATLQRGTEVTVLQSFLDSQVSSPTLYSLVKQVSGSAVYYVNHGSKFDVSTPTATAGARGTKFKITITNVSGTPATELEVLDGTVAFNTPQRSILATVGDVVNGLLGGLLGGLL